MIDSTAIGVDFGGDAVAFDIVDPERKDAGGILLRGEPEYDAA
jgi:hypothetical protein